MFSLHETTQRRVCRAAFVVGCVLPTLCVIVWIAFLHRPGRENDWQRMLRQQLHVRATVGEIRSPYPGVTQLLDVQFADLRTEHPLGSIGELRIEGWKASLVADRIEISAAQLPVFATAVATWVSSADMPALQLQAETLRLVGSDGESFELKNVRMKSLASSNAHRQIELQAESIAAESGGTIRLVVEHHAGQAEPLMFVSLDTQRERLPAWLLADLVPGMKGCAKAQFSGVLRIESLSEQLDGKMSGRLEEIDLEQWFDLAGPARLEGIASLQLETLQWRNHRIEIAAGHLCADAGRVSPSLLAALSKEHYFPLGQQLARADLSADQLLSFDELACNFRISSAGIEISGVCESAKSSITGCLLALDGQPLLIQPQYRVLQVARLVQVFSPMPPEASWLPATVEAIKMADELPLPSASSLKK